MPQKAPQNEKTCCQDWGICYFPPQMHRFGARVNGFYPAERIKTQHINIQTVSQEELE
jgi:hypothetical protein